MLHGLGLCGRPRAGEGGGGGATDQQHTSSCHPLGSLVGANAAQPGLFRKGVVVHGATGQQRTSESQLSGSLVDVIMWAAGWGTLAEGVTTGH